MTADDVVTASLAALASAEVTCMPALRDPALLGQLTEAQLKIFSTSAMLPALAERYQQ